MAIDRGIETSAASPMRNNELKMRSPRKSMIGWPLTYELPGSPVSRPPSQSVYCSTAGSSKPSSCRLAARLSSVASRPRIARAGSLGSAWVSANTTTDTTKQRQDPKATRRRTNFSRPTCIALRGVGSSVGGVVQLCEPDVLEAAAEVVEVQHVGLGYEALDLGRVGVEQVVEDGDDVPALVVLLLLHLADDLAPGVVVGLGQRLLGRAPRSCCPPVASASPGRWRPCRLPASTWLR